jgi:hypothetical protein
MLRIMLKIAILIADLDRLPVPLRENMRLAIKNSVFKRKCVYAKISIIPHYSFVRIIIYSMLYILENSCRFAMR